MSVPPALSGKAIAAPRPVVRAGALACVLALSLTSCHAPNRETSMATPARPLAEVLAAHTPGLMAMPGVVGTAEARTDDGRPCILVLLAKPSPELRARIPREIEGWPVRLQVSGELHAMPDSSR